MKMSHGRQNVKNFSFPLLMVSPQGQKKKTKSIVYPPPPLDSIHLGGVSKVVTTYYTGVKYCQITEHIES